MLPQLECQKTDCCLPIRGTKKWPHSRRITMTPYTSSTLISIGLFPKMERKYTRGQGDRNPFVSLGSDYLHGDEGPVCSAVNLRQYSLCLFFPGSLRDYRKDGVEGRSPVQGITHCEERTQSLVPLCWLNYTPAAGYLVKQIVFSCVSGDDLS